MKGQLIQIALGFDQLFNTLFGGFADETISARAWRLSHSSRRWLYFRRFIDTLFFFQTDHCYRAYLAEVNRMQLPRSYNQ